MSCCWPSSGRMQKSHAALGRSKPPNFPMASPNPLPQPRRLCWEWTRACRRIGSSTYTFRVCMALPRSCPPPTSPWGAPLDMDQTSEGCTPLLKIAIHSAPSREWKGTTEKQLSKIVHQPQSSPAQIAKAVYAYIYSLTRRNFPGLLPQACWKLGSW